MTLRHTPWGAIQSDEHIADGIIRISTASHGGYHLSATRWAEFNERLQGRGLLLEVTLYAGNQWFEEDCDWAYCVLVFNEHFSDEDVYHAVESAYCSGRRGYNSAFLNWLEFVDHTGCLQRHANFKSDHQLDWQRGSMATRGDKQGWMVWFNRVGDDARRTVMMAYPDKLFYTDEELTALTIE